MLCRSVWFKVHCGAAGGQEGIGIWGLRVCCCLISAALRSSNSAKCKSDTGKRSPMLLQVPFQEFFQLQVEIPLQLQGAVAVPRVQIQVNEVPPCPCTARRAQAPLLRKAVLLRQTLTAFYLGSQSAGPLQQVLPPQMCSLRSRGFGARG